MDNMLIVALMVVSCILINPFVSALQTKNTLAVEQTQPAGEESDENGEDPEDEEDEEEESEKKSR